MFRESNVRDKQCKSALVRRMQHLRAIQPLLALALLHQKVIATVSVEREFPTSGSAESLLRAAVGLEFRHTDERV